MAMIVTGSKSLNWIKRYLSAEPDAVLIVMFENDLYDDRVQEKSYFSKPLLDHPESLLINHTTKLSLLKKSKLCLLFQRAYDKFNRNQLETIIKTNSGIDISNNEQKVLDKMSHWLVAPSMFDKQWSMSEQYMDFTISQFRQEKVPVYIVFLSLGALGPGLDKAFEKHGKMLDQKVGQWAKLNNIPFLSLVPAVQAFLEKFPSADLMIEDDGHPTPKAHKMIADLIWSWLVEAAADGKSSS